MQIKHLMLLKCKNKLNNLKFKNKWK
jgi:hypothetical protein